MVELLYYQEISTLTQGIIMRFVWSLFFSAVFVPMAMATEIDVAGGVEYFQWEEFSDSGRKYLDETGPRYFVEVVGTNHLEKDWLIDFGGRFYSGTVDYDGETQPPTVRPVVTDTDYNGFRTELGLTHKGVSGTSVRDWIWLVRFALGVDMWRRSLRDTVTVAGYVERYTSVYAKVGVTYLREGEWSFGIGAKAPFNTNEEISDYPGVAESFTLKPEGRLSLYATVDRPINASWVISLAYDSYRFAKSDSVVVGSHVFSQPESTQDTLSLALRYRF